MKNPALLLFLVVAIALCGYLPFALSAEVDNPSVQVIIKVKPDIIIMPEGTYKASLDEVEINSDAVMELNRRFNLMSIEKMFAKKKPAEEIAEEFPEREERAPEEVEEPDLENIFLLKFPEHTDLKALIDEYGTIEEVIYIEENKEVSIF